MLRVDGRIGRYEITRRVAHGGMGSLYLAHDPVLDRTVALKLFHRDLDVPDAHDGFVREARAIAALSHPNIITIYDYGEYSSQPYIVMEYIDGETLAALVRRKAGMPEIVKVRWLEELCAAVAYAHERGIIHRDIKPANLMIDKYGRLHVLDFGIARMRGTLASSTTASIGTPGYMAPEQLRGGAVDHRSDLFSIGVVGYTLFAQVEPFVGDTAPAISMSVLEVEPRPLQEMNPSIDPDLARIITRALEKQAERRIRSADEFFAAVTAVRRRMEATSSDTLLPYVSAPAASAATLVPPVPQPATSVQQSAADATEATRYAEPTTAAAPPDEPSTRPRQTTRSAEQRREALIQKWIELAREHLASGELEEARDACREALEYDPRRPAVHALLAEIDRASGLQEAEVPPVDVATIVPRQKTGNGTSETGTGVVAPPVQSATPTTETELPGGVGPTVVIPPVPVVQPSTAGEESSTPPRAPSGRARVEGKADPQKWTSYLPALPTESRRTHLLIAAAVTVLIVVAAVMSGPAPSPPPPPPALTRVTIDAVPWAEVTAITPVDAESTEPMRGLTLGQTPLRVELPPGTYLVTLERPALRGVGRQERTESVLIAEGVPVLLQVRFDLVPAEEFFDALKFFEPDVALSDVESPETAQ